VELVVKSTRATRMADVIGSIAIAIPVIATPTREAVVVRAARAAFP
jgi:hypothetical protein